MPPEVMVSFKAMSATGFLNQLYKVGHALYLIRYFVPYIYNCREGVASPKIYSFFKAIRENEAAELAVGTAGFCWGAKYVTELCWDQTKTSSGARLIDCGFIAHPSNLRYPSDIEKVSLPLSCAAAEIDPQMSAENAKQTEDILVAKTAKTKVQGVEHEFVMYEKAYHGFAVRADEDNVEEAERGRKAEAQAIAWFGRWFAGPPPTTPGNNN
jgi:dienelactone hydrolase